MSTTETPDFYIPEEYRSNSQVQVLAQELQQLEQQLAAVRPHAEEQAQHYMSLYNEVNRKQYQLLELLSQPILQ